jgi:hypothetical protein
MQEALMSLQLIFFFLYGFAFLGFAHQCFDVIEMVSMAI